MPKLADMRPRSGSTRRRRRINANVSTVPVLSERGREFLAGKIPADTYFAEGRREAERTVTRDYEAVAAGPIIRQPVLYILILALLAVGVALTVAGNSGVGALLAILSLAASSATTLRFWRR